MHIRKVIFWQTEKQTLPLTRVTRKALPLNLTLRRVCLAFFSVQVFYYSTSLFVSSGLPPERAKFATIGIGIIMVGMTLVSIPLMDRTGRRTLHLYGLGGMFIFSIFITISFLIKVSKHYSARFSSPFWLSVEPRKNTLPSLRARLFAERAE